MHPWDHRLLGLFNHPVLHDGFLWAAACLWTTRAAHVAAALLRAALTATDAEEHDEQEGAEDDQQDRQPVIHDEFDFPIRVSCRVTGSIDGAEIDAVIPPHHLIDDQVGVVLNGDFTIPVLSTQYGFINASFLDDGADGTLAVSAVVGRILTQLQSGLIGCGVVLQHRILAERLVPPGDENILRVC